ncbi:hypothetical protein MFFC18_43410 [Mariniblastus fucicola]|uniref:Uncharacterized protein n=3 Tax=Mariniblastus fucicola TaxID=980251 RepID=A0A5B9PIC2_9BACT|nr:hypothetical protein MFFC18_43410 [Mariniblastus fucicola]
MTNPLLVEAAEELFVPVLIYNNHKGSDEKLLKHFEEPAWNNPVVRYLDAKEQDLIPRKELVLTTAETASRMADSLRKARNEIPAWLTALAVPTRAKSLEQATFSMY